ncbi:hypothetical protein L2E82_05473 [Cichorium intybus]|uniref:Uncharacterized protein n=1 Tax=Cichorium intybus TaxID=13427 RepID=A0ACB9H8X3_CICIN|nr:hypothetical protein L2E82_05473 [Cichorium intybus]
MSVPNAFEKMPTEKSVAFHLFPRQFLRSPRFSLAVATRRPSIYKHVYGESTRHIQTPKSPPSFQGLSTETQQIHSKLQIFDHTHQYFVVSYKYTPHPPPNFVQVITFLCIQTLFDFLLIHRGKYQ